jgi:hypothetical protein
MTVRAYISNVNPEFEGLNIRYLWRTVFLGPDVNANPPNKWDADNVPQLLRTPDMNDQACRAAVRDAIQERATALGYGELEADPELIDDIFRKL